MRARSRLRRPRAGTARPCFVIGAGLVACLAIATPAAAQDTSAGDGREQIVLSGRLVVAEGETISNAVIFNGTALIEGRVTESVVVFNGRTVVSGTVGGDVIVFNGSVSVRSGATVGGDLVTVDSPSVEPGATVRGEQRRVNTEFDAAQFGFASRLAWWIGYSVSTLLLGLLLLAVAPGSDGSLAEAAGKRTGAAIGFGAAAFFGLPVVGVVMVAIIVAIPLGLFLLLALALVYTVGYVVAGHVLGRRLVRSPKSRFVAFLAGWAILRVIALVPLLGGLIWMLATIVGLGVLWVAARRTAESPPSAASAPDAPAMPPMPQPTG